ncbi:16S rRNA (guanine(527)-N(7))-methyltransferase RsmG [Jannaschia sp. S6380]|uniref:16S rRNA (guanine(527)-N(7))-methyltransferase RsmG n=1 Tax=Jannaschia sp. S6380 TaxID=2926408 RepID=UPI001FF19290|nr:16S rRNA (guanine(527)-N(7))-methyltransferase RsmG [Jannaschia sp. S6380]MCK0168447.1 16S rRNA (guanine(527)-N(7))-methyltransferase RsmG [Jannaschia sp. S6380]
MNRYTGDVSRETVAQFHRLEALVRKWTPRINLVSQASLEDFFRRHIDDAVFLYKCAPAIGTWLDLGSGGGFPGLVIGILSRTGRQVTLIESDTRKCAFLRTARRELALSINIISARIEAVPAQEANVVSARALAPLPRLLSLATPHGTPNTTYVFLKGNRWRDEVDLAMKDWRFDLDVIDSPIEKGAAVLRLRNVERI